MAGIALARGGFAGSWGFFFAFTSSWLAKFVWMPSEYLSSLYCDVGGLYTGTILRNRDLSLGLGLVRLGVVAIAKNVDDKRRQELYIVVGNDN